MADETKNRGIAGPVELTDEDLGRIWMNVPTDAPQAESVQDEVGAGQALDDGPAKIWLNVPDGADLELRVGSLNPSAAAVGRLETAQGKVEVWPHSVIAPGPKRRRLTKTEDKYVLNILVAFSQDHPGKVGIFARILSQGNAIGTYFHAVSGGRGDIKTSQILIDMQ